MSVNSSDKDRRGDYDNLIVMQSISRLPLYFMVFPLRKKLLYLSNYIFFPKQTLVIVCFLKIDLKRIVREVKKKNE